MRYVQKKPPVRLIDPNTGDPTEQVVTFDRAIQVATMAAMSKQAADALALISLRDRFAAARELDFVPVDQAEYDALLPEFKRPTAFAPTYILAAEEHIRAWVDAPEKLPAVVVALPAS
jgi:hypothetical protein